MLYYVLLTAICAFMFIYISADEGVYVDTKSIELNQDYLLSRSSLMSFKIRTSHTYLAGTSDSIVVTAIGEFSSSGPHNIGSFNAGAEVTKEILLDRRIGKLQRIILANSGSDGWLPSYIQIMYENEHYELTIPRQWISTHDTEALIEPNTQLQDNIMTFPTMSCPVANVVPIYD